MRMFGTNGIRGIANADMNPELAIQVGKAIGSVLDNGPLAIATDPRTSSQMIKYAICSGLMATGIDIIDLGDGTSFFDGWHTTADDINVISAETLEAVGSTVAKVIYRF